MSLTELIQKVGNNIECQWLDSSCTNARIGKNDATLTVHTSIGNGQQVMNALTGARKPSHRGLIVWVPTEATE